MDYSDYREGRFEKFVIILCNHLPVSIQLHHTVHTYVTHSEW